MINKQIQDSVGDCGDYNAIHRSDADIGIAGHVGDYRPCKIG